MSSELPVASSGWGVWFHAVRPVPELVELSVQAEQLGASALLLADEGIDRDIYVTLTAVAVATKKLALFPAVTNAHSRHPVATAAALASLAEVAPGRVVVGLGAGGSLVFNPMGLRPDRPYSALAEAVEVIDALLSGVRVDHEGQFRACGAQLDWAPGRLPIAIAGRGPRVERLSAARSDWALVSGKPVAEVAALSSSLRSHADGAGRSVRIAWNPMIGWEPGHVEVIRSHLSYMTVDMPQQWQQRFAVDERLVGELRAELAKGGPSAAGRLVPPAVIEAFSVTGDRADVVRRLAGLVEEAAPDLVVFGAHDYNANHIADIAALASEAGLASSAELVRQ